MGSGVVECRAWGFRLAKKCVRVLTGLLGLGFGSSWSVQGVGALSAGYCSGWWFRGFGNSGVLGFRVV